MSDERRDDTGMIALFCPHCEQMVSDPIMRMNFFDGYQQMVYLKCPECGEGINKQQISDGYREYTPEATP